MDGMAYDRARARAKEAAEVGDIRVLQELDEGGFPWSNPCNNVLTCTAAYNGSIDCLTFLLKRGCRVRRDAFDRAAMCGQTASLRCLHESGFEQWRSSNCHLAAQEGHIASLRYLHENKCPWDASAMCKFAAYGGHIECLRYAHTHGCPCDVHTLSRAVDGLRRFDSDRKALLARGRELAEYSPEYRLHGHLACIHYLFKHRCADRSRPELRGDVLRAIVWSAWRQRALQMSFLDLLDGSDIYKPEFVDGKSRGTKRGCRDYEADDEPASEIRLPKRSREDYEARAVGTSASFPASP